jgi:hypothetical protein
MYDSCANSFTQGKIEIYPDPYETHKTNWGQLAMDLLEENRKTIQEIKKKHNLSLMPEQHIKEDFYIVELNDSDMDKLYLVKAISSKRAIDKVWEQYISVNNDNYECELHACKINDYFKNHLGDVVSLN